MRTTEKIRFNEKNEVVYQTINSETKEVISEMSPIEKFNGKLFREREFYIITKRTVTNFQTFKMVSALFLQKVLYRVPNRDGYDCHYFYFERGFSVPVARVLDPRLNNLCGLSFQVSPSDERFTKKIGVAKRLPTETIRKAMQDREFQGVPILGLYDESGEERV